MPEEPWYYFKLPFLFCGYFECEHCHRPLQVNCQLQTEDEWQDRLFDIQCGCGWGKTNCSGQQIVDHSVVYWNKKIRSLH